MPTFRTNGVTGNKESRVRLKQLLIGWQDSHCFWCLCKMKITHGNTKLNNAATFEHIKPLSRGGKDNVENVVLACRECNRSRGNKRPNMNDVRRRKILFNYLQ